MAKTEKGHGNGVIDYIALLLLKFGGHIVRRTCADSSGVATGAKWRHAPRGAGLGSASARFLKSFKNAF